MTKAMTCDPVKNLSFCLKKPFIAHEGKVVFMRSGRKIQAKKARLFRKVSHGI